MGFVRDKGLVIQNIDMNFGITFKSNLSDDFWEQKEWVNVKEVEVDYFRKKVSIGKYCYRLDLFKAMVDLAENLEFGVFDDLDTIPVRLELLVSEAGAELYVYKGGLLVLVGQDNYAIAITPLKEC